MKAATANLLVAGVDASKFPENGEEYDIHIRAEEQFRTDASSLALVSVPSAKYGSVPLSSVVQWSDGLGFSRINRYGRQRPRELGAARDDCGNRKGTFKPELKEQAVTIAHEGRCAPNAIVIQGQDVVSSVPP